VTIKLRRGRVATGRLVTRDGAPVAGAALLVTRLGATSEETGVILATTRADGSFRIEGIEPTTRHALLVRHFECEMIEVSFPADELATMQIDFGTLRVGRGAVVAGVVTDEAGAPIADAGVLLTQERGLLRGRATDATGRFEFAGVSAGPAKLKATAPGSTRLAELALDLQDEEIMEAVTLAIPAGLAIAGRVTDVTGAPVARATLVLRRMGDGGDAAPDTVATVWSEADGRFRFAGLDTGAYRIEAQPERSKEMRCAPKELERVDAGTTDLQVVLPDGAFATGRVLDGEGRPVGWVMLLLSGADGKVVAGGHSEDDGTFRIPIPSEVELRLEACVFDPRHPGSLRNSHLVASADHVRGGGPPLTLVVEKP
jgi:protocatechuate 3,4-dioxygenase beta subunit